MSPACDSNSAGASGRWFRRRTVPVPTWRTVGLAAVLGAVAFAGAIRALPGFLAVTARVPGAELLVVEAWGPDFVVGAAWTEYRQGGYKRLFVTGGPMERGEALSEYGSYAELGRATLLRLGAPADGVEAAAGPKVVRDRTLASAQALRSTLAARGALPKALCVMTPGAHARRTRLMYELAFGPEVAIGIIAVPDERYEAAEWWRTSVGLRTELSELIGYLQARVVGRPAGTGGS